MKEWTMKYKISLGVEKAPQNKMASSMDPGKGVGDSKNKMVSLGRKKDGVEGQWVRVCASFIYVCINEVLRPFILYIIERKNEICVNVLFLKMIISNLNDRNGRNPTL